MAESTALDGLVETWKEKQYELKKQVIIKDDNNWSNYGVNGKIDLSGLCRVGGVDISVPENKTDFTHACPCLVVLSYPELKILHKELSFVHLTQPFVSEFLAFREVDSYVSCIEKLRVSHPDLMPQVIMVDGNGRLHTRGFGIACHLGVLTNIPTIGVAKTLFKYDGIENGEPHKQQIRASLKNKGDSFALVGNSRETWGMALRSSDPDLHAQGCKPIYVSVGHRVGLETAVHVVKKCCKFKNPEPTRQADILSREFLKNNYAAELAKCQCNTQELQPEA